MTHSNSRLIALCGLIIVDIFMIFVSFYLAAGWVFNNFVKGSFTGLLIIQCVIILTVYLFGGYALRRQLSYWHIPGQMAIAIVLALIIIATVGFITKLTETDLNYWRTQLLTGMLFSYVWLSISRFVVRFLLQKLTEEPSWMIVGSKDQIDVLQKDMHATYGEGRYIIHSKLEKISDEELYEVDYDGMILMPEVITKGSEGRLLDMRFKGKRVFHVSEFYERYLFKVPLNFLDRTWFATSAEYGLINQEVPLRVKRIIDVFLSLILLILTFPLMIIVSIGIYLNDREDVFFKQVRTGIQDKPFKIIKFRTMVKDAEKDGVAKWAEKNDKRITPIGKFLRVTRIDELPQLINVLIGDMSFIGPRPERPEFVTELEKQIPMYNYRHAVKPGITGWAQVMYRYGSSTEDALKKLEYDLYYIRNYSLMLDVFIVLRTVRVVLFGMGR